MRKYHESLGQPDPVGHCEGQARRPSPAWCAPTTARSSVAQPQDSRRGNQSRDHLQGARFSVPTSSRSPLTSTGRSDRRAGRGANIGGPDEPECGLEYLLRLSVQTLHVLHRPGVDRPARSRCTRRVGGFSRRLGLAGHRQFLRCRGGGLRRPSTCLHRRRHRARSWPSSSSASGSSQFRTSATSRSCSTSGLRSPSRSRTCTPRDHPAAPAGRPVHT